MKRLFSIIACLLFITASSQAQYIRCATYELHKMQLERDAQYRAYYENIGQQMEKWSSAGSQERTSGTGTITVPVVVHVLWNTNAQNISDNQIRSQIDVLNEDFNGTNTDQSLIPNAFKSVFGNANIYFCLASRTSTNTATTGIERRQVSTASYSFGDATIKDSNSGGLSAWDRDKYLNVWICNLSGGLLGYTQMPGGPASTDGTVILYTAFGRVGTLLTNYNKGRTATHEIGHWLGLIHTWGDDGGACTGSDYISDTPNQADATYGCPAFPLTDACSNASPGVMFMNYMDYSDDGCMHMFTAGQAAVMRNILNTTRAAILTSNGCTSTVGFKEVNAQNDINIYPNPANDVIHVEFHMASSTVLNVAVFDLLGKKITSSEMLPSSDQKMNLDISALNAGLYTLVVNTELGKTARLFTVTR